MIKKNPIIKTISGNFSEQIKSFEQRHLLIYNSYRVEEILHFAFKIHLLVILRLRRWSAGYLESYVIMIQHTGISKKR